MHLNDEPVPGLWLNADQIEYLGERGDEAH
jgi:hypothetical protein